LEYTVSLATEVNALEPTSAFIALSSGVEAEVLPMNTIQLIRLMKVFTNGVPPEQLAGLMFGFDPEDDDFGARLVINLILAIPNAEDEVLGFIKSMLKPAGLIKGRRLTTDERERNTQLLLKFDEATENPSGEDLIDIIEKIIVNSEDDLRSLGKKIATLFRKVTASRMPKAPTNPESQDENSLEA
jgi:hypothetical protein